MKKIIFLFIISAFLVSCQRKLSEEQSSKLWKAYQEQNYFRLDKMVSALHPSVNSPEVMLFKAKLGYVFNRPEESNEVINVLLKKYSSRFNDSIVSDLILMRSVNYTRLEDYRNALADGILFIRKYGHLYDSAFIAETRDDNLVREALAGVPKLQTTISSDVEIPVQRDKAGLINVPVILGNDSVSFVFDSGASMSVITSSLTAKYGIQPLNKKIFVMAITGKRIEAQLALVNLKMGNIEIRNSPFIVFPDSVLSFGDVYSIRGIIGFPVMNSLGEFILKNDQSIVFPKIPETATSRNFALDQATPVILVKYQQDTLPFHFDTGAMQSMLYSSFFNRYKDTITNNFQKKISHLGGAGGILELDAFVLPTAVFSAGNVQNSLDSLRILTKPLISTQEKFYGNLGQDFMKNYKEMKVNFKAMNISFADKK